MRLPGLWKGMTTAALVAVLFVSIPAAAEASGGRRIEVRVSTDGPWTAGLVGFDLSHVDGVTYFIRDARGRWRRIAKVTQTPFEAAIEWWEGNNDGTEAVTAHVELADGTSVKDPGGWRWVNGTQANPRGKIEASGSATAEEAGSSAAGG
jgi:hypothetical protein